MPATDEQRARVRDAIADLEYQGRTRQAAAYAAVIADSEALAAKVARCPSCGGDYAWYGRRPEDGPCPDSFHSVEAEKRRRQAIERVLGILPPEEE